jgi:CheY-like chemotaxis protein
VEGNPANLEFMRALFRKIPKARLITAERPEQGLELAFSEKPDFILIDIGLPGMDGYELLACLREHEELQSTPIVALSANAMPEEQARGIEAGFDDYLAKPARADELLGSMERLLCRKKGNAG